MSRITGVFDDLTLEVMARAYAETCRQLPVATSPAERDLLAKRILGTAALGERDPAKMRDDAIAYIHGD
jgi:hypothetical protein